MAQQADGTVYINSKIDTSGVEADSKKIESALKRTANTVSKIGNAMKKAFSIGKISGEENAEKQIETIGEKVERLKESLKYLHDIKGLGFGNEEYDSVYQALVSANEELKQYRSNLASSALAEQETGKYVNVLQSTLNGLKMAAHAPVSAVKALGNAIKALPRKVLDLMTEGLKKVGSVAKSAAKTVGGALLSGVKKLGSAMLLFHKNTQKSNGSLSNGIKTILKYGLGIRSIYVLFNKVRNFIKEGFSNLFAERNKFKNSADNLKASLLTLKNALATAFAPIVQAAIPYIQRLVEWLTKAADAFGQFMAALLGQKTYTKAIKQTTDALKEETKASNKQLSSLDKLNNLTSQSNDNADSGTGSMFEEVPISDKWKNIAQWFKDMWENSDFYDLGKMLGEKLKTALDSIPWDIIKNTARKIGKSLASLINGFIEVDGLGYSIGKTLVEGINTGFEFFNAFVHELHWDSVGAFITDTINGFFQNIDWPLIYDTLVTSAAGLASAINSFTALLDWEAIANTISNFFNTLVDTIYTFVTETDWISIASQLGKTISDAFTGIDWSKAGQTVGEAFKAFFNFLATTIENIDWWAVGESVKEFLVGIDWAGVAQSFFEAVGAAFGGIAAFIGGLIGEGVENAKEYFQQKIEEAGGNVVEGILVGIAEALVGIGDWIYQNIFTPFLDGFKKAFDINSPSKVMEGMGSYIIAGLLEGLKDKWGNIVQWITDKVNWIKNKFSGIRNTIGGLFGGGNISNISMSSIQVPVTSIPTANVPYLATGAVIPPNAPFMAMLGDNKRETEVVSPLSTMKQALKEALSDSGFSGGGDINLNLTVECEGYQLLSIMQKLDRQFYKQNGRHAFS